MDSPQNIVNTVFEVHDTGILDDYEKTGGFLEKPNYVEDKNKPTLNADDKVYDMDFVLSECNGQILSESFNKIISVCPKPPFMRGIFVGNGSKDRYQNYYDLFKRISNNNSNRKYNNSNKNFDYIKIISTGEQQKQLKKGAKYIIKGHWDLFWNDWQNGQNIQICIRLDYFWPDDGRPSCQEDFFEASYQESIQKKKDEEYAKRLAYITKSNSARRMGTIMAELTHIAEQIRLGREYEPIPLYIVAGMENMVSADLKKNLVHKEYFRFIDENSNYLSKLPDTLSNIKTKALFERQFPLVAILRGGGDDKDISKVFDREDIGMSAMSIDWALTVGAVGHTDNHTLLDGCVDICCNTPTSADMKIDKLAELAEYRDRQNFADSILSSNYAKLQIKCARLEQQNEDLKSRIPTVVVDAKPQSTHDVNAPVQQIGSRMERRQAAKEAAKQIEMRILTLISVSTLILSFISAFFSYTR